MDIIANVTEAGSFEISWTPVTSATTNLSHYIIQLDEASPVWVQSPPVTLFSPEARHVVNIRSVDMCGQKSDMVSKEIVGGGNGHGEHPADHTPAVVNHHGEDRAARTPAVVDPTHTASTNAAVSGRG